MNTYEKAQWQRLRAWQLEAPPPAARWFGKAAGPASQAVQTMIPGEALRVALQAVQAAAVRVSGRNAVLRQAGVEHLEQLRKGDLARCDRLAARVRQRAVLLGSGSGAVFGVAGIAGLVADVPALLTLAFRTIQRVGYCYGEPLDGAAARPLEVAIFALASANSAQEKQLALQALREPSLWDQTDAAWRDGLERAAERELAKEAASMSLNNLAVQLGRHLGWRKAAKAVPVIGAVIGGSVNGWYLYDVATVSRYCFQMRWLLRRYPGLRRLGGEVGVTAPQRLSRVAGE